jgi:hypothetical protein
MSQLLFEALREWRELVVADCYPAGDLQPWHVLNNQVPAL